MPGAAVAAALAGFGEAGAAEALALAPPEAARCCDCRRFSMYSASRLSAIEHLPPSSTAVSVTHRQ
eukprot:6012405-Alexandrium_andersonii.AAC.1